MRAVELAHANERTPETRAVLECLVMPIQRGIVETLRRIGDRESTGPGRGSGWDTRLIKHPHGRGGQKEFFQTFKRTNILTLQNVPL